MSKKSYLIDNHIKIYYIYMLISFKLNYIPYKIVKSDCLDLFTIN